MDYCRGRICRAAGLWLAGGVVGQGEAEHEEEDDQRHFDGGNGQSENDVPGAEVDFSGLDRQIGAEKQCAKNCGVKLWGNYVVLRIFRHANLSTQARWRLIK